MNILKQTFATRCRSLLAGALLLSCGASLAAVTVTTATGGSAIASNTAPACSAGGTWTTLTNPRMTEGGAGEIGVGTIILSAPTGFEFNTAAAVNILVTGSNTNTRNINNLATGSTSPATVSATQISFSVTKSSNTTANSLTWQGIQVRPTIAATASGNLSHTGSATISGVTASTNLGTLTETFSSPPCRMIELNSSGGTTATDGLHFYIEDTTHIQVRRLNNTGQVYSPSAVPPSNSLDNGIFLRANDQVYGPDHTVSSSFNPDSTYHYYYLSPPSPANPTTPGVLQTANHNFGINNGPQVAIVWKYTTPLDFITAEVTLTIPSGYTVSAAKPVRYYHVFDTYLGGSDSGCGVKFTDSNGKLVVGTYLRPTAGCTSQTSLPAGVTVVESFRERSGGTFPYYCTAGWSEFYGTTTNNCYIKQSAPLSNYITGTYQDTGIGIEWDFTAPGTYTFSYDFVIGTTVVPPYDHIEIQHDGAGTLCPDTIRVLACTSSTVPCPAGSYVNTGTLTGTLSYSPASPSATWSPSAAFSVGSANSYADITLQGSATATYTLSASGFSSVPLNGVKCWNTATSTQNCTFTVANTPCSVSAANLNCLEGSITGLSDYSGSSARLYTKLAGADFGLDVAALKASGALETAYVNTGGAKKTVTVDLVDNTAGTACPVGTCSASCGSKIATKTIRFPAGDTTGRSNIDEATGSPVAFNVTNAYRNVICRVTDSAASMTRCSSDAFAIRPSAVTLQTSTAMSAPPSSTAANKIGAGVAFKLQGGTAGSTGYGGTLTQDTGKLTAQITTQDTTQQSGGTVGTLNPNTLTANAAEVDATYSEVGYLYLAPGAYRDDSFTAIDSAVGDCITDTTADANLADTLSGGKYGCSIGNKTGVAFGRFVPDHFAVTTGTPAPACSNTFTYFDQDGFTTPFTLTAQDKNNNTTKNYNGVFAKLGLGTWSNYVFATSTALPAGATLAASSTDPSGTWSNGAASVSAKHKISRPTALAAETAVTITAKPQDADGVTLASATAVQSASTPLRFGRLWLGNAYGPVTKPLDIPYELQYWNGSAFILNVADGCTLLTNANIGLGNYQTLTATDIPTSAILVSTLGSGKGKITLTNANKAAGSVDLVALLGGTGNLNMCPSWTPAPAYPAGTPLNAAYLRGKWCASGYDRDPVARATFGIFGDSTKPKQGPIYIRENH